MESKNIHQLPENFSFRMMSQKTDCMAIPCPSQVATPAHRSAAIFFYVFLSSYSASSRPSVKTTVRHWVRLCALHGITPFRPQVADNGGAKALEYIVLMMF